MQSALQGVLFFSSDEHQAAAGKKWMSEKMVPVVRKEK